MVDRAVETGSYDTVRVDDRAVARAAVEHLLRYGHRRVAFVGDDQDFATARDRLAGYADVLAEYGVRPDPGLRRPTPPTDDDAVPVLRELTALPDPPTALFAANARAGARMAHALHTADRPELAFVSFGDFPLSQSLRPPVTYVDHDPRAIGRAAMRRLLEGLSGEPGPPRDVFVDTVLVPFGGGGLSTGIATAVRALKPNATVFGCEVATSTPLSAAFAAGAPTRVTRTPSFVDG